MCFDHNKQLAHKIGSMNRSFFFIHTKIDENVQAEKEKKPFSEYAVLKKIGIYCLVNLDGLLGKEDIF